MRPSVATHHSMIAWHTIMRPSVAVLIDSLPNHSVKITMRPSAVTFITARTHFFVNLEVVDVVREVALLRGGEVVPSHLCPTNRIQQRRRMIGYLAVHVTTRCIIHLHLYCAGKRFSAPLFLFFLRPFFIWALTSKYVFKYWLVCLSERILSIFLYHTRKSLSCSLFLPSPSPQHRQNLGVRTKTPTSILHQTSATTISYDMIPCHRCYC